TMGPNPHTQLPVCVGVRNTEVCMSSKPVVASGVGIDVIASSGCTITFHAEVAANGRSGSIFTLSPVFRSGPIRNPVTDSIGTLNDTAKGFSASFAISRAVIACPDWSRGSDASCARTALPDHGPKRRSADRSAGQFHDFIPVLLSARTTNIGYGRRSVGWGP